MCDKILGSIDEDFNSYPQADEYFTLKNGIQLTPELLEMWVNPTLIKLMSRYLKHSVFARNYPNFHQINPPFTNPATKDMESAKDYGLNVGWHFDTVNLLLFPREYLLLTEVYSVGASNSRLWTLARAV